MKIDFLVEPELEFGNSGRHIDVRFGIMQHGPLDRGLSTAPSQLKLGIVGTQETIQGVQDWLQRERGGIQAKDSRLSNLFPPFPGFSESSCFGSSLIFHDRWLAVISNREMDRILTSSDSEQLVYDAVDLFMDRIADISEPGGPTVIRTPRKRNKGFANRPLQDEATRAWNFHTALYYKAGGIPWRLVRNPSELSSCFIGISFYKSLDGDRLVTSVAQVFNERGEGVIIKGGNATIDKDDRQPHLSAVDANALLKRAVQTYRKEHKTFPARVVIHKTSGMNDGEIEGFRSAVEEERIDTLDLLSMRRSFSRLFREGTYPPLRGTLLRMDETLNLMYLRGSVNFFEAYPGLYVPRPLEFAIKEANSTARTLAEEVFSLSKLNWNNTQFDGGEPITVRAARRVGDILKCVPEGGAIQPSFRFFM